MWKLAKTCVWRPICGPSAVGPQIGRFGLVVLRLSAQPQKKKKKSKNQTLVSFYTNTTDRQHGRFKKGGGGGGGRLRIISLVHLLSLFTISLSFTSLSISLVHFKVNYSASVYPGMRWPTASHLHGNAVLYLPLATSVLFHLSHCPHRCASTCDLCSTPTMGTKRGVRAHTHAHPHTHSTLVWM